MKKKRTQVRRFLRECIADEPKFTQGYEVCKLSEP